MNDRGAAQDFVHFIDKQKRDELTNLRTAVRADNWSAALAAEGCLQALERLERPLVTAQQQEHADVTRHLNAIRRNGA